jgi:hypothetical protein
MRWRIAKLGHGLRNIQTKIGLLGAEQLDDYRRVKELATSSQAAIIEIPDSVDAIKGLNLAPKHLFCDEERMYPVSFDSSWEKLVLDEELAEANLVGWYRNDDGMVRSLCIPYVGVDKKEHGLYPDVIFFHLAGGHIVPSIVDPHRMDQEDSVGKAAGLARYADQYKMRFGRIELVALVSGTIKRIDLRKKGNQDRVLAAVTSQDLKAIYEQPSMS